MMSPIQHAIFRWIPIRTGCARLLMPFPRRGPRGIGAFVVCSAMLLLPPGCREEQQAADGNENGSGPARTETRIAVVGAGEGDPLWPILVTGAKAYAQDLGTIQLVLENPARRSAQSQIASLQKLRELDIQGICIHIEHPQALQPMLRVLHERSVRIVSIGHEAPEDLRSAHVGFDEAAVGRELARLTAAAIDRGPIALLHAGRQHPEYGIRLRAFEEEIRRHARIELFKSVDCKGEPQEARNNIQSFSNRFPRLAGWVMLDDWPLREPDLDQTELPPGCTFVTVGGLPYQWPFLERGECAGILAADYGQIGYEALRFCELSLRLNTRFERLYHVPLRELRPGNLPEYRRDWAFWSTGESPPEAATGQ